MHGTSVIEGANGAYRVDGGTSGGDVTEARAVLALCVSIRGVGSLNGARAPEELYGEADCWDIPGVDGDDNRGGCLAFSGLSVGVEIPGGEHANGLGVEDRLRETGETFVWALGEEGNGEGVTGKLGLVQAEAKGQPGGRTHREPLVKLRGECVEVGREGGGRGGSVGDEEGDGPSIVDLARDSER